MSGDLVLPFLLFEAAGYAGVSPGPAVPMRLLYLGRTSNEVTIGCAVIGR